MLYLSTKETEELLKSNKFLYHKYNDRPTILELSFRMFDNDNKIYFIVVSAFPHSPSKFKVGVGYHHASVKLSTDESKRIRNTFDEAFEDGKKDYKSELEKFNSKFEPFVH